MKKGQAMVEYLIIVTFLVSAFAAGASIFRDALMRFFDRIATLMSLPFP